MKWLLDTCVVSEIKRPHPAAAVVQWLQNHDEQTAICMVTVGEILHGIERMPPSAGRNSLQSWFELLHHRYAKRTFATDEPVWRNFARLKASLEAIGRRQEDFDILIAATASAHGLTLVTRNTRHFEDTGVPLLNPWATI